LIGGFYHVKVYTGILAYVFICFWSGMRSQGFVKDGLILMYTFDQGAIKGEVVKDVSGNGNDGKIIGTLKQVKGVIGEALEFDRGQNYVEIPELGRWEQVSIECWAQSYDLGLDYQGIVSTWQWEAGKVHFKFESRQIQVHKNDGVKITFSANINTWYHIVYTTDTKANKLLLYVDGENVAEGIAGTTPENMDERRIGSEHDGRFLKGMIDEVRIYKRVLTDGEIANNYKVKSNIPAVNPAGKLATCWGLVKQQ